VNIAYKYCGSHGVFILEDLKLKITPPNQFNDPFEFTPRMIWSNPLGKATSILANKEYLKLIYAKEKSEGKFTGSFREFRAYSKANRPTVAKHLSKFIPLSAARVQKRMLDSASTKFGVLCLSKRRDSILMWGHYSDKHRGLVIGFDASNPIFRSADQRGLQDVKYIRERVIFDATWADSDPRTSGYEQEMVFSKNEDWRYEEELRQLFELHTLEQKPLDNGSPGYFMNIPPLAILSVTLGAKCADELEKRVRSAVAKPSLSHVNLDRAALHESEFALEFKSQPSHRI
jgi:hypothetical protein